MRIPPSKDLRVVRQILRLNLRDNRYLDTYFVDSLLRYAKAAMPKKLEGLLLAFQLEHYQAYRWLKKTVPVYQIEIQKHNEAFIQHELRDKKEFFASIEKGLDDQQCRAVIIDEHNHLVIAGAGSGKTTTIVGKVQYLTQHLGISPTQILPISFTRASAESLEKRINVQSVKARTFHSFGLNVIRSVEGKDVDIFDEDPYRTTRLFSEILSQLIADPAHSAKIIDFFLNYLKPFKSQFEFSTYGEYAQYLKEQDFYTYKKIPAKSRSSYRNETVKSIEESAIANFLLLNQVRYEYETPYQFKEGYYYQGKYKPDFTIILPDNRKVYIEHFGIDQNYNVPPFFVKNGQTYEQARLKYIEGILWKRQVHADHGTLLIETYSYEQSEGRLIEALQSKLIAGGVPLHPMTPQQMYELINQTQGEADRFIELLQTFLNLFKSSGLTFNQLRSKNQADKNKPGEYQRTKEFLDIFELFYQKYEEKLKVQNKIDFSDMIARATKYIEQGAYPCPWTHIIIDEFQDISVGRYHLLQAIRKQNPAVKLFCVGDDWQSIYRFTGSDIGLFKDFEKYFGPTTRSFIETTYRFNEPLISISSDFILKNPNQTPKKLAAPPNGATSSVTVYESGEPGDDTGGLLKALKKMEESGLNPTSSMYILGRYNNDLERLSDKSNILTVDKPNRTVTYYFRNPQYKGQKLDIKYITAHKAKGLEADYIAVLNCNSGVMGFPCLRSDDPILGLLLSSVDQFENGEERRLFYVALTRAKKGVSLIADKDRPSKFIIEFRKKYDPAFLLCPDCKSGFLVIKKDIQGKKFYGCNNFLYGCSYTRPVN